MFETTLHQMFSPDLTDGGRISGSATASLIVSNTLTNDSGSQFSCVVSNANGSVISSDAPLTVLSPLTTFFTEPMFTNGQFQVTLNGAPMSNYVVYVSADLVTWKTLITVTTPSGSTNLLDASPGLQRRFYRAKLSP